MRKLHVFNIQINTLTIQFLIQRKEREREREGGGGEGEEVVKHVTIHISVQQVYQYRHASLIAAQTSDSICCCQKRQQHLPYSLPLSLSLLQVIIIYNTRK